MALPKKIGADEKSRKPLIIGLIAVIVIAIGFTIYQIYPKVPHSPTVKPDNPVDLFIAESAKHFTDVRFERVSVKANDDRSGVVVGGSVAAAKDLEDLKALLANIQPQPSLTYEVRVGR